MYQYTELSPINNVTVLVACLVDSYEKIMYQTIK